MGAIAQPAVERSFFSPADHLYVESVRPRLPGARRHAIMERALRREERGTWRRRKPKGKDAGQGTTMAELLVCKHGDIAEGGVRIVRDGALEIGVIRHGGHYYAYRNHCPHQGGPACEGLRMPQIKELIDENGVYHGKTYDESDMHIVCPWHGYEFHLSDGVHVADKRIRLQKFKIIERDGDVYVAI
jgi:nitrite reductase/ring-hydroxylating ferredoxin subunit